MPPSEGCVVVPTAVLLAVVDGGGGHKLVLCVPPAPTHDLRPGAASAAASVAAALADGRSTVRVRACMLMPTHV
jgi:hypothetical protein